MLTQLKNPLITIGITLASGISAISISTPAYSITLVDLSTFTSIGDVSSNKTVIQSGSATVNTSGGTGSLEEFLGIDPNNLETAIPGNTYGSAIKSTFSNINSGDVFSFNWDFASTDQDQAFVTIANNIQPLTGNNGTYSYAFTSPGSYNVGIGVVDVNDSTGQSTLTLSNAQIQAVPWETDTLPILGSTILFGIGVWAKRKYTGNSKS
ncbi:PEP-CTERM sorting domain-containing protein [Dolichospermum sp. LEGE 00246]|uniref:PEP-CTERM sorting domain-containing protein n=1 Tax=Dolichospermum sp. LEGE 00246 TaxID=1828605 RepID=UPI00187F690E|nr:PEP-CTERM sorting domain-containing protein [Dolichospermum sp. LEGE 00246]MBE9256143.1 PEP-CTERM sorting domain-containing protein [Dolichospermum sp. LEGE 00246]